jgi:DNA-binding FrmR family transcriptional regulator
MSQAMHETAKDSCIKRLNRIEGQVRGLSRMVEEGRYCIDVITQISAVRAALRRVEEEVLRDHIGHCVKEAMQSDDVRSQDRTINELIDVFARSKG